MAHRISVVVESADPAFAVSDFRAFEANGMDVSLCRGPEGGACPVLDRQHCPLIDAADVVVHHLDSPALLTALRAVHADVPVVAVSHDGLDRPPAGCTTMPRTCSVDGQVGIVQSAALIGRSAHRRGARAMQAGASPSEAARLTRDLIEAWSRHPSTA